MTYFKTEWFKVMESSDTYIDVKYISKFIQLLYKEIKENHIQTLGVTAVSLDKTKLSPEMMVAFLRSTFIWRDQIPKWNEFLEQTHSELEDRGIDSNQLLQGLNMKMNDK